MGQSYMRGSCSAFFRRRWLELTIHRHHSDATLQRPDALRLHRRRHLRLLIRVPPLGSPCLQRPLAARNPAQSHIHLRRPCPLRPLTRLRPALSPRKYLRRLHRLR